MPDPDPVVFSLSANLQRRHLNESQRAMVAAKLANLANGQKASSANLLSTVAQPDAAALLRVSARSVADAKKVQDNATPRCWHVPADGQGPDRDGSPRWDFLPRR